MRIDVLVCRPDGTQEFESREIELEEPAPEEAPAG